MEAFLEEILPKIIADDVRWKVINHQSKTRLLRELPVRLRGYSNYDLQWRPRTLVLIDRDEDDCNALKASLEQFALLQGLHTKSSPSPMGGFEVVNRIVIEELEAWHFGDPDAVRAAFPGAARNVERNARYRDSDAIIGGTHEALLRVLKAGGHFRHHATLPKIDVARRIGRQMTIERNRSMSFGQFISGLDAIVDQL